MAQCGPGPAGAEGRGTHPLFCFLRVDFVLVVLHCAVKKEALQIPKKWCCDSLRGLRSVSGALSWLPAAARADPGCLGENEFSSNALGRSKSNLYGHKQGCW